MSKAFFSESKIFRNLFERCQKAILWLFLVSMVTNLLMLAQPIYMLQVFSRVLSGYRTETLLYLTLITIFVIASMHLLLWVRGRVLLQIGQWLHSQVASPSLIRCPDQILRGVNYGTQSLNDLNTLVGFISSPAMIAILDLPWSPLFLLVLFLIHPALGIIAVIGAAVLVSLAVVNEKITAVPYREANGVFLKNRQLMDATLRNSETIQAMGMMESVISHWQDRENEGKSIIMPAQKASSIIQSTAHFFRLTLQITIIAVGAYYVLSAAINPGGMIAASLLLARVMAPIENAITSWQLLLKSKEAYSRLVGHLNTEERQGSNYLGHSPTGLVEVKELYYRPSMKGRLILERIQFQLAPGETLGIIGPSGSGKTTLARLIMGVHFPTAGKVSLDGVETFSWNRNDFGQHVGYLPQAIELFEGTIAQNIARMGEVDKALIIAAAKQAGLHQKILRFPEGYDTNVGDYGSAISGGMRQRIAYARALYSDPSLLILDEPNSNLDDEGLMGLTHSLTLLKKQKKTIILITHLRGLLTFADKLLLLNQGQMAMYGPTNLVLEKLQQSVDKPQNEQNVHG